MPTKAMPSATEDAAPTAAAGDTSCCDTLVVSLLLRPTREDVLDRISGRSSAADGKFQCLECAERFDTLAATDTHKRKAHAASKRAGGGSASGTVQAGRTTIPAVCPDCNSQFATMQQLQRHFTRKHVDARMFKCEKCEQEFKADAERKSHQAMCFKGVDAGKAIRCQECGLICTSAHQWKTHKRLTAHRSFEVCWNDAQAMAAAAAETASAEAAAAAVVAHIASSEGAVGHFAMVAAAAAPAADAGDGTAMMAITYDEAQQPSALPLPLLVAWGEVLEGAHEPAPPVGWVALGEAAFDPANEAEVIEIVRL